MYRTLLRSKIHRAVVTDVNLNYEGSLVVDSNLLEATGMLEYEQVQVVDIENGMRLETYLIKGKAGSGIVQPNGAAARLLHPGDHIIIMSFIQVPEPIPDNWLPTIIQVDDHNRIQVGNDE